jgi:hypothetical protein
MNEHVDYQAKPSAGNRFLWWCAGADPQILKFSSYADHVKYAGIGGVVLATSVLAFLSMGFAMHIIFDGNIWVTIPVAIVWSIIIFNLDRFIVSSTGKGDGKETMGFFEFFNAAPRIAMAIMIGLAISAPLETYIFQTEIQRELNDVIRKSIQMKIGQIETKYSILIAEKDSLRAEKKRKLESLEEKRADYENEIVEELKKVKCGEKCEALKKEQKKFEENIYNPATNEFHIAENEWKELLEKKKSEQNQMDSITMAEKVGFLDQILALEKLSEEKVITIVDPISKKQKTEIVMPSAFWAVWIVRLLFMMLEVAPVLLKLMLVKGPYDYMQENINQILETKQGISIEHIKDEHKKITILKTNHNPNRIIKIVERQNQRELENAIEAIDRFAEKEKKEIEDNPEKFIKDSDDNENV